MTLCLIDEEEIKLRAEKIKKILKDKAGIRELLNRRKEVLIMLS